MSSRNQWMRMNRIKPFKSIINLIELIYFFGISVMQKRTIFWYNLGKVVKGQITCQIIFVVFGIFGVGSVRSMWSSCPWSLLDTDLLARRGFRFPSVFLSSCDFFSTCFSRSLKCSRVPSKNLNFLRFRYCLFVIWCSWRQFKFLTSRSRSF